MYRFLLSITVGLACYSTGFAGYFEYDASTYTSNAYFNVTDNDSPADQVVNVGDVIKMVTILNYTDSSSAARTALGIAFVEVATHLAKSYTFAAPSSDSLTSFLSTNSFDTTGMETTGSTVGDAIYTLISRAGTYDINSVGFDFTDASLGLTSSDWTVDLLAGMDSTDDFFEFSSGALGQSDLTTEYPDGTTVTDPTPSTFDAKFALTTISVRDDSDAFSPGGSFNGTTINGFGGTTATADIGSVNDLSLDYSNTGPNGTNLSSLQNQIALPGNVPEPSSLAILGLVTAVAGLRRRRR